MFRFNEESEDLALGTTTTKNGQTLDLIKNFISIWFNCLYSRVKGQLASYSGVHIEKIYKCPRSWGTQSGVTDEEQRQIGLTKWPRSVQAKDAKDPALWRRGWGRTGVSEGRGKNGSEGIMAGRNWNVDSHLWADSFNPGHLKRAEE